MRPPPSRGPRLSYTDLLASGTPTGVATPAEASRCTAGWARRANRANPGGAGNAEGNWWTPSYVLDFRLRRQSRHADDKIVAGCIYKKKTEEIKQKQAINALNAEYKVEKLAQLERQAAERTAKNAALPRRWRRGRRIS